MSAATSFVWFDYETFGRSPAWDRLAQFAGLRTDARLVAMDEPVVLHCRVADDYLPDPGACRITGLSPQAVAHGLPEHRFVRRVLAELGAPGTVSVGYNSLSFDDEFTRFAAHRCFEDPYAHEWRDGASRWDLLDVVRLARALRPDGIEWPLDASGQPTVKLEALSAANGIEHGHAHDALSDVEATLGVARLLRARQPKLWDWCFAHRDKASVAALLDVTRKPALVHVAGSLPRERAHLGVIVPIAVHPSDAKRIVALDLATDPDELAELDVETLRHRAFARNDELGDATRIGLRTLRTNRCPVLAPFAALTAPDAERLGMNLERTVARRERLLELLRGTDLNERLTSASVREWPRADPDADVDGTLYTHGFRTPADTARIRARLDGPPAELARAPGGFEDARVDEMLFRYKARNLPQALSPAERAAWDADRAARLRAADVPWRTVRDFDEALRDAPWTPDEATLREALLAWRTSVAGND